MPPSGSLIEAQANGLQQFEGGVGLAKVASYRSDGKGQVQGKETRVKEERPTNFAHSGHYIRSRVPGAGRLLLCGFAVADIGEEQFGYADPCAPGIR